MSTVLDLAILGLFWNYFTYITQTCVVRISQSQHQEKNEKTKTKISIQYQKVRTQLLLHKDPFPVEKSDFDHW